MSEKDKSIAEIFSNLRAAISAKYGPTSKIIKVAFNYEGFDSVMRELEGMKPGDHVWCQSPSRSNNLKLYDIEICARQKDDF